MKITEVAFFAYAVSDMKTARAFYEGVLGLTPNSEFDGSDNGHWVEYDIGTATVGIGCAPGIWEPSSKGASAALEVDDFDTAVETMKAKAIPIVMGPHDFPTCEMIVIADPDGNRITLHKRKARG
jgi:predicted enzyme related to lactoylglutathione lyase